MIICLARRENERKENVNTVEEGVEIKTKKCSSNEWSDLVKNILNLGRL